MRTWPRWLAIIHVHPARRPLGTDEIEDALCDLVRIQQEAEEKGDLTNVVRATVEMLKGQRKDVTHCEPVNIQGGREILELK